MLVQVLPNMYYYVRFLLFFLVCYCPRHEHLGRVSSAWGCRLLTVDQGVFSLLVPWGRKMGGHPGIYRASSYTAW